MYIKNQYVNILFCIFLRYNKYNLYILIINIEYIRSGIGCQNI